MNIFVLSLSPRKAAQFHCDKHVVKMILETAQLLYCVHWVCGTPLPSGAYKKTHPNHPCGIWARTSLGNYRWLCALGHWLCVEFTFRYGKVHKTAKHLAWLTANEPCLPELGLTSFAQAMPIEYKHEDPVEAYRTFYRLNKQGVRGIVTYKKRPVPEFLKTDPCAPEPESRADEQDAPLYPLPKEDRDGI